MERNYFIYRSYCEIAIVSNEVNPEEITKELNIIPERSFKRGEQSISEHSSSITIKPHNLWAIGSKPLESEEETITQHIAYLKSIFLTKFAILQKYKENGRYEVSLTVWIKTDNAGIGFDLKEADMVFINSIFNRTHFSLIIMNER